MAVPLDLTSVELLEELASRLQLVKGKRKIEVVLVDGRVVDFHVHARIPVDELRAGGTLPLPGLR
jgi:hypothetical protein